MGQQFGFVDIPQFLDMLQLDNQMVLDDDVNSVFIIEPHFLVLD